MKLALFAAVSEVLLVAGILLWLPGLTVMH